MLALSCPFLLVGNPRTAGVKQDSGGQPHRARVSRSFMKYAARSLSSSRNKWSPPLAAAPSGLPRKGRAEPTSPRASTLPPRFSNALRPPPRGPFWRHGHKSQGGPDRVMGRGAKIVAAHRHPVRGEQAVDHIHPLEPRTAFRPHATWAIGLMHTFHTVGRLSRGAGALLIDKPLEWTSFDVVNKVRHLIRRGGWIQKNQSGTCRHPRPAGHGGLGPVHGPHDQANQRAHGRRQGLRGPHDLRGHH